MNRYKNIIPQISIYILLLVGFSLFFYKLFAFFIGGDDIWLTLSAPHTLEDFKSTFLAIQQYRPLPYSFFSIYRILPFNTFIFHVISVFTISLVSYLFFVFLSKVFKVSTLVAVVIAFSYGISHIMFYNVFALSGMVDLIYLLFFWTSLLNFYFYLREGKKSSLLLSCIVFVGAIFSKEIFISIPIIITAYLFLFTSRLKVKKNIKLLSFFWIPTIIFYAIKINLYKPVEAAYTYSLNPNLIKDNVLNFSLWLINFKHGWQMGMPLPVSKLYYLVVAVYCVFILWSVYQVFKKDRKPLLFFVLWGIAGLLPFFFLQRVLVFYLNISLIALLSIVSIAINIFYKKNTTMGKSMVILFLLASLFLSKSILTQWLQYSFVVVSIESANNFYNQVYKPYDWKNTYDTLCLTNLNGDAAWAIANGNEINLLQKKPVQIYTVATPDLLPSSCFNKKSLIFQNDSRRFIRFLTAKT